MSNNPERMMRIVTRDGVKGELKPILEGLPQSYRTVLRRPLVGYTTSELGIEDGPILESREYRFRRRVVIEVFEYEEV